MPKQTVVHGQKVMRYFLRRVTAVTVGLAVISSFGCATTPSTGGSFYKTRQTELRVESETADKVFVNNKYVGVAPLKIPLEYGQLVEKQVQNVTYWENNPGLSVLLTIVSLGLYLPFSFIPVDTKATYVPQDQFRDNMFSLELEIEGARRWKQEVKCNGETTIVVKPVTDKEKQETMATKEDQK
jgi:hypothetical protein